MCLLPIVFIQFLSLSRSRTVLSTVFTKIIPMDFGLLRMARGYGIWMVIEISDNIGRSMAWGEIRYGILLKTSREFCGLLLHVVYRSWMTALLKHTLLKTDCRITSYVICLSQPMRRFG